MNSPKISGPSFDDKGLKKSKSAPDSSSFEEFMKIEKVDESELEKQQKKTLSPEKTIAGKRSGTLKTRPIFPDEKAYESCPLDFIVEPENKISYLARRPSAKNKALALNIVLPKKCTLTLNIKDQELLKQTLAALEPTGRERLLSLLETLPSRAMKALLFVLKQLSPEEISTLANQEILLPEDKNKSIGFALSEEALKKKGTFDQVIKKPLGENSFLFVGIKDRKGYSDNPEHEEAVSEPKEREFQKEINTASPAGVKKLSEEELSSKIQGYLDPQVNAEISHQAEIIAAPVQGYLTPVLQPVFTTMVSTVILMNQKGLNETEIVLNSKDYKGSIFYGTRIIFSQFATAKNALNIKFISTPEATALLNANLPSLSEAFQKADLNFKVSRLEAELETKNYEFKRKKSTHDEESGGKEGGL